jgi:hypothetical protein
MPDCVNETRSIDSAKWKNRNAIRSAAEYFESATTLAIRVPILLTLSKGMHWYEARTVYVVFPVPSRPPSQSAAIVKNRLSWKATNQCRPKYYYDM